MEWARQSTTEVGSGVWQQRGATVDSAAEAAETVAAKTVAEAAVRRRGSDGSGKQVP